MEIKEAKELKHQLEQDIFKMVSDYREKTGAIVTNIDLEYVQSMGPDLLHEVAVEVKL